MRRRDALRRRLGGGLTARRGAAAGAAAAAAWAALEPGMARLLGTPYGDVRLLGGLVRAGRWWRPAGLALHVANGAAFGSLFALGGGRGLRQALAWVGVEAVATWPLMAMADRLHPDRLAGTWPRLLTDRRVIAHEAAMHAVFAVVLGVLTEERARGR